MKFDKSKNDKDEIQNVDKLQKKKNVGNTFWSKFEQKSISCDEV